MKDKQHETLLNSPRRSGQILDAVDVFAAPLNHAWDRRIAMIGAGDLPRGTVTFLFTNIESSTAL
jgi:hypothetical protein